MSTRGKPILVGVDVGGSKIAVLVVDGEERVLARHVTSVAATRDGMTLPVGLAALQSSFQSDFRSIAAGVTRTVIPILLFFVAVQRYFVRGLAGAVKG